MREYFDQVPERKNTDCVKWKAYGDDVLPLWVADMDFRAPEPVLRALHERVEHGIFGYPCDPDELRQVILARLEERYQWRVQPEAIVFLPGVVTGFNLACHAFGQPGGGLLVQPPVYHPILNAHEHVDMVRQESQLCQDENGSYYIDWDSFEQAIDGRTRMFILCNPHNPVGRVFCEDELQRMAEICLRRNVLICSDEIHGDLIYEGHRHIPIASLAPEIEQQSITLMAPSKTFNLPGLQCAFAVIPNKELRTRYVNAKKGLVSWVNVMGLAAAKAAYESGGEWLKGLLAYLQENRDYLAEYVQANLPGVRMVKPEGTYLAWLDCRQTAEEVSQDPYNFYLKQGRVALNDGKIFGAGGEWFVRLNFGCPRSTLEEALIRMSTALQQAVRVQS